MSDEDYSDVVIRRNTQNRTYEALLGDELVGLVVYEPTGPKRLALTHAAVEEHQRMHGIGTRLVTEMLDDIRKRGQTITVYCQVVVDFLHKHPEYTDLIDSNAHGLISPPSAAATDGPV